MSRVLRVAAVQAPPIDSAAPLDRFVGDVRGVLERHEGIDLVVYPELHLMGTHGDDATQQQQLTERAVDLGGDLIRGLGDLARDSGIWLVPGSIAERRPDGGLHNTAVVFSPSGELVGYYRKIFPWRPFEQFVPGDRFTVVDLPGIGRIGLSICYDAWFPEVSRHLAWMGAEVVVNVVKTTTPDRRQEVVLARANSIVNQTFTVSVNAAGPVGMGCSLIVDPQGDRLEESMEPEARVLVADLDLDLVTRVREHGTEGTNRMWSQFDEADSALELPLYGGRIVPERWAVQVPPTEATPAPAHD